MHAVRRLSGPSIVILTIALIVAVASAGQLVERRFAGSIEHPAIEYAIRPTTDDVTRVDRRLQSGELQLVATPDTRYLRAVLSALDVPVESQILVFKKKRKKQYRRTQGHRQDYTAVRIDNIIL